MENENVRPGFIIELNGKKFIKDFIQEQDVSKFQYLVLSTDIEVSETNDLKNIFHNSSIIPKSATLQYALDDDQKSFKMAYLNELCEPYNRVFITTIMYSAVEKGLDMILICSEEEDEYGYLKQIRKFIEDVYDYPTFKYSKYKEYIKSHDAPEVNDIEKIKRQLLEEIEAIQKDKRPIEKKIEGAKKAVRKMDKKQLKEYCKLKDIPKKKYKKLDKKELREFVCDLIDKEMEANSDLYDI